MRTLEDQVREYARFADETLPWVDPADVMQHERARGLTVGSNSTPGQRGIWIAVAAAALVLVLVGALPLLLNSWSADTAPAETSPPSPPSTIGSPTTILPSDTTLEELGPSNVVPGPGTLSWQRYDGDRDTLPLGIDNGSSGGFVFPRRGWLGDDQRTWESDDGLVWEASTLPGVLAGYRRLAVDGNWAQAWSSEEVDGGSRRDIYFRDGDMWELIDLPIAAIPATAGITWSQGFIRTPVENNGVTFATGSLEGTMDLATVYGPDSGSSWSSRWDPAAELLAVFGDGQTRGHLDMAVVDNRIDFTDALLGPEVVFTVEGSAGFTAEMIADRLMRNEVLRISYGVVAGPDRNFDLVGVPWDTGDVHVFTAPSGGFAVYNFEPQTWYVGDDFEMDASVWTSPDGVTWKDHGVPEFVVPASTEAAWISSAGENRLWATRDPLDSDAMELWTSADGVSWQLVDIPLRFDEEHTVYETDFGFVAAKGVDKDLGISTAPVYLVSTDGVTFHPVTGPPLDDLDMWLFESSTGAAGDFLYAIGRPCVTEPTRTCSNSATDARVLWIGRFDESP